MNVLVTGASGGIGGAVTDFLLEKGITVFALDLKAPTEKNGAIFFTADVTDETSLSSVAEKLRADGVILDAIINIAGVFTINSFLEIPDAELKRVFDVNFFGAVNVNRVFYPLLRKGGRIVITTSEVAPLSPMPFNGIYHTSKTALDTYAKSLRIELNVLGQKVITVRPGAFSTALSKGSLEQTKVLTEKTTLYKAQSEKFYRLVKGFMGKPLPPKKLAPVYLRAVTVKRPKLVYKKHTNPLLLLLNLLPQRLQCAIVKTLLKPKNERAI